MRCGATSPPWQEISTTSSPVAERGARKSVATTWSSRSPSGVVKKPTCAVWEAASASERAGRCRSAMVTASGPERRTIANAARPRAVAMAAMVSAAGVIASGLQPLPRAPALAGLPVRGRLGRTGGLIGHLLPLLHGLVDPPLLEDRQDVEREVVEAEAGGEPVEHHEEDGGQHVHHDLLLRTGGAARFRHRDLHLDDHREAHDEGEARHEIAVEGDRE